MTKVLTDTDLDESLIRRVCEIFEVVEVFTASSAGETLEIISEI